MANTNSTIGAAKTYATVQAWETAGYAGVGAGDTALGRVFGEITENALLDDDTGIKTLESDSGEGFDGTPGSGAKLKSTVNDEILDIRADDVTVRNLEFDQEGTDTRFAAVRFFANAIRCEFYNNLLHNKVANRATITSLLEIAATSTSVDVHDNIIFGMTNSGTGETCGIVMEAVLACNVYNNTITDIDNSNVSGVCYGIKILDDADHTYKNNLITDITASGGGTAACYSDSSPTNATTAENLSDDATSPDSDHRSKSIAFADAGSPNYDYHLAAGDTDAIGEGIGPGSDAQVAATDIDGEARSGATCDIGADERVAAGNRRRRMMLFGASA